MMIKVREADPLDFDRLEEILLENNMLQYPEIDGKKAMQRIYERMGRYFLLAEDEENILGVIRGVYDGSRALIHQIAVDPSYQGKGVGKKMISELANRFFEDSAGTVSVTSGVSSKSYFKHQGFIEIPVTLMLHCDIKSLIFNTQ